MYARTCANIYSLNPPQTSVDDAREMYAIQFESTEQKCIYVMDKHMRTYMKMHVILNYVVFP